MLRLGAFVAQLHTEKGIVVDSGSCFAHWSPALLASHHLLQRRLHGQWQHFFATASSKEEATLPPFLHWVPPGGCYALRQVAQPPGLDLGFPVGGSRGSREGNGAGKLASLPAREEESKLAPHQLTLTSS